MIISYIFKLQPWTYFLVIDYILTLIDQQVIVLWLSFSVLQTGHQLSRMTSYFGCLPICKTILYHFSFGWYFEIIVLLWEKLQLKQPSQFLQVVDFFLSISNVKFFKPLLFHGSNCLWDAPFCILISIQCRKMQLVLQFTFQSSY